jgi:hypothetical protein
VTLACVIFFALLSNYLVRRQFDRTFERFEQEIRRPPETPIPMPAPYGVEAS